MEFLDPEIEKYALQFTEPESVLRSKLNRETHAKVMMPRMLSGHLQGQLLKMFTLMIRPKRILEIGTYTGYSALCFADGLIEGAELHTIDINEELETIVRKYFEQSSTKGKIHFHIGNAIEIIKTINGDFDLVFIDADKDNYSNYFDLVIDRVPTGGFIIADNVLWSGKVLMNESKMDKDTRAIHEFNKKVFNDERVESILLPVRDGLMVLRRK